MKLLKNSTFQTVIVIVILLIILNPSYSSFKEYSADLANSESRKVIYKRTLNGLIFSVYQKQIFIYNKRGKIAEFDTTKYLGVCLNFINITHKPHKQPVSTNDASTMDTGYMMPDTSSTMLDTSSSQ